jgi:hypothetical protein
MLVLINGILLFIYIYTLLINFHMILIRCTLLYRRIQQIGRTPAIPRQPLRNSMPIGGAYLTLARPLARPPSLTSASPSRVAVDMYEKLKKVGEGTYRKV